MTNLLKYLIGMVAVLLAVVVFVGLTSGGIDRRISAEANAEIQKVSSAITSVTANQANVTKLVKADPGLFQPKEINGEQFDAIIQRLKDASATTTKIQSLLKANDEESEPEIQQLTNSLAKTRVAAITESSSINDAAQQLADFKKQANEKLPEMEADIEVIRQFDPAVIEPFVAKAVADWPEKKQNLENRLQAYKNLKQKAIESWDSTAEARQKVAQNQLDGVDIDKLLTVADALTQTKAALQGAAKRVESLVDQLYWSWDKILADLEINEGRNVTFRQKLQTNKVRALVPEGETVEPPEPVVEWKTINKSTYDNLSKSMGMVVEHKPAGKFDSESVKVTQPPGYAYIAPQNQGSNRYGRWEHRNDGTSFWAFYGQYSFMRNMFWGPSYRPISGYDYNDYRTHYNTGRTYYGRDKYGKPRYGSTGSVTRNKFASSKYVSSNGFKNSQYVKTGGKYRGSAYQRKASTNRYSSSSSRSSRSSRSSSSRSYSSRSSGFRSSGGFGGK